LLIVSERIKKKYSTQKNVKKKDSSVVAPIDTQKKGHMVNNILFSFNANKNKKKKETFKKRFLLYDKNEKTNYRSSFFSANH